MSPQHPPRGSIAVVLGTRPEIIKLGHVIRLLGDATSIVHTGQHYDASLSSDFFDAFQLPAPDHQLGVGGGSRGAQIGSALQALDELFLKTEPAAVIVQGDTNSAVAGALAANARGIPLVHVEAGLRSFDRRMPEEHNRVIADHLADLLCAPTATSRSNLLAEGISEERIVITGNTVVEAVTSLLPDASVRRSLLAEFNLEPGEFILSTFHRPENVDDLHTLRTILDELARLPKPVVLPLHPRTAARAGRDLATSKLLGQLRVVEPLPYPAFLGLSAESAMMISDSGGVQEEASVLKRPVLVVRRSTERPEVIGTFAERVEVGPDMGTTALAWLADLPALHEKLGAIASPYGDGTASKRTVDAILELLADSGV
ncbi:MAG: UDP-N-acetylglucosamine 2-epimerase (non-hydrolyzing) [Acidimicrobiia bacterium]